MKEAGAGNLKNVALTIKKGGFQSAASRNGGLETAAPCRYHSEQCNLKPAKFFSD
jgi:hypothetical protein